MTGLIARENDIVTCIKRNHPMFRITRDVVHGEVLRANQFEALHPKTPDPTPSALMPECRLCGSPFTSPAGSGGVRVHFEDGYHA